ncbi:hypothetical protein TRVL_03245 [Trypanosoma vivax]|nr:hypothetical protein TRVL_03245 [Trypanosoma vivax]
MNTATVFSPSLLRRTALVTCMSVPSVDRASLNPSCCGFSLSLLKSPARRTTTRYISMHSVLASVAFRKDAILFVGLFGSSSGTMMPCSHLSGTCPARKLQLNSRKMHLLGHPA